MDETGFMSKFNDGWLQIVRLNNMWMKCQSFRRQGRLEALRWEYDNIYLELYSDALKLKKSNPDSKDYIGIRKALNNRIKIAHASNNHKELYGLLNEMEELLRELQTESGKGGKYEETEDAGFFS